MASWVAKRAKGVYDSAKNRTVGVVNSAKEDINQKALRGRNWLAQAKTWRPWTTKAIVARGKDSPIPLSVQRKRAWLIVSAWLTLFALALLVLLVVQEWVFNVTPLTRIFSTIVAAVSVGLSFFGFVKRLGSGKARATLRFVQFKWTLVFASADCAWIMIQIVLRITWALLCEWNVPGSTACSRIRFVNYLYLGVDGLTLVLDITTMWLCALLMLDVEAYARVMTEIVAVDAMRDYQRVIATEETPMMTEMPPSDSAVVGSKMGRPNGMRRRHVLPADPNDRRTPRMTSPVVVVRVPTPAPQRDDDDEELFAVEKPPHTAARLPPTWADAIFDEDDMAPAPSSKFAKTEAIVLDENEQMDTRDDPEKSPEVIADALRALLAEQDASGAPFVDFTPSPPTRKPWVAPPVVYEEEAAAVEDKRASPVFNVSAKQEKKLKKPHQLIPAWADDDSDDDREEVTATQRDLPAVENIDSAPHDEDVDIFYEAAEEPSPEETAEKLRMMLDEDSQQPDDGCYLS